MAFTDTKHPGDKVLSSDWNAMVDFIEMISSCAYGLSSNALTLFGASSHTHDDRYYTETELNAGQLDTRYYTESEVDTISGSIITHVANNYQPSGITTSYQDDFVASGTRLNAISAQSISGGSIKGTWIGDSIGDAYIDNDITLTNITQITNRSHTSLSDIGTNTHTQIDSKLTSLFDYSTNAKSLYHPSGYVISGQEYSQAYASAQRVKDLFDHELYLQSGTKWTDLTDSGDTTLHIHDTRYYTESEIDTISGSIISHLSSNYYNKDWINSFSGSIDTRLDTLESQQGLSWSGAAGFYTISSNYIGHSSNADIHFPSSNLLSWLNALYQESGTAGTDVAWSGASEFYSFSSNTQSLYHPSGFVISGDQYSKAYASAQIALYTETYSSEGDLTLVLDDNYHPSGYVISGDAYSRAYISTSTGVFALASHTHKLSGMTDLQWNDNNAYLNSSLQWNGSYWVAVSGGGGGSIDTSQELTLATASGIASTVQVLHDGTAGTLYLNDIPQNVLKSGAYYWKSYLSSQLANYDDSTSWSGASDFYGFSSNINEDITNLYNTSSSLDSRIDSLEGQDVFDSTLYITSSESISRFADSGAFQTHKSDDDIHYPSSSFRSWLDLVYEPLGASGTAWSGASDYYSFSSSAKSLYHPSGLVISGSEYSQAYASAQRVKDSFDSTLYITSSNAVLRFPNSSNVFISGVAEANMLSDVDTQSTEPSRDQVLKWNGSNWVPAAYNATFVFSIASFSDGESTTQLIGAGEWESDSNMSYTATYNNGPPDGAWVQMSNNGGAYSKVGSMTGPAFTAGTNDEGAINYPASKDQYLRFRLSANCDADTDSDTETAIYFRNYIRYGALNKNTGLTADEVSGLSNKTISNDHTSNFSINAGVGEYLVFAHPASYTNIPSGNDYEDDGGSGFKFNSITVAMSGHAQVSITNSAGYTENYKVYTSNLPNLGNSTLNTSTSTTTINKIYYGITTTTSSYDEDDVEGLANSSVTNDYTQTWNSVTAGVGEYLLWAIPKRHGEKGTAYTFYDNGTGFEASFEDAETVSVTNVNGWTEDYYVYRSENANLGSIVIRTS